MTIFLSALKPLWSWPDNNILWESVENDRYINSYCTYVSDSIINYLKSFLNKKELTYLSNHSYNELDNTNFVDLVKRIGTSTISFCDIDKGINKLPLLKQMYINLLQKSNSELQAIHWSMPKSVVMIDLYILNDSGIADGNRLKHILLDNSNLEHEITHAFDLNKLKNMQTVVNNFNWNKYRRHQEYYCNNGYEYHAFTNQLIRDLDNIWKTDPNKVLYVIKAKNYDDFYKRLKEVTNKKYEYLTFLNKRNRRNTVSRIYNYFYDKGYKDNLLPKPVYHERYDYKLNNKGLPLFETEDFQLYTNLLVECLQDD